VAEKRRVNLSLNLSAPRQRQAWNILRSIPPGQRTDTVCRMLCEYRDQETLLNTIRTVIQEELRNGEFQPKSNAQAEQLAGDVDENVLGFLRSLQEGDDMT
jgi:hypothetical protein